MEIGDRIKALRELRGMTQTELAQGMGYTDKSTICKIEANQRNLPHSKVVKAAKGKRRRSQARMDKCH